MIYLPLSGLIALILILYSPELTSTHIPILSDLDFDKKTNITLTFSIAIFAAIEGYAMFKRAKMEENRHLIADARNELEKAYVQQAETRTISGCTSKREKSRRNNGNLPLYVPAANILSVARKNPKPAVSNSVIRP
jgi:hypothetical protein